MQEMQPKGAQAVFSAHLLWEGVSSTGPCRGRMQVWSKALKLPAPPAVTEKQKKDPDPLSLSGTCLHSGRTTSFSPGAACSKMSSGHNMNGTSGMC